MRVRELLEEALIGKYLQYYQYVYAISPFCKETNRLEGIRIDTSLGYDCIDSEWIGCIEDFDLDELYIIEESEMGEIIDNMCKDLKIKLNETIAKS